MFFEKCYKCHKKRVGYLVKSPRASVKLCLDCLLLLKLKGYMDISEYKLHILDSLTPIGGFIIYFLFPPFIIYDLFFKKRKPQVL